MSGEPNKGRGFARLMRICVVSALLATPARAATEIAWWHAMAGELGRMVEQLAADFNASQAEYRIVPEYKGQYTETMTAALFAIRTGKHPAIVQVNEVATATMMAAKGATYPVYQLMREQGAVFDPAAYLPAVSGYYTDASGNMLSFPFNASTPILYYNKDQFRVAGLDPEAPPRTWPEVEAAAQEAARRRRAVRLHHRVAVLDQCREPARGARPADLDQAERLRRARYRAGDRERRRGEASGGAGRMAEDEDLRLWRPRRPRRREIPRQPVRHVCLLVGDAAGHPGQRQVRGRLRADAVLAGRRGRAAERDHRRRDAVGAEGAAGRRIQGRGAVLCLFVAARGAGALAPGERLPADHPRRL